MENKLGPYDVDSSLYAMMRAAQAKQDKEHMKLCAEEAQKRKKQLALIMKDMPMEKSQALKAMVADKLAKSFSEKELTVEEQELISIDVMLKATQIEKSEQNPEAAAVVAAAGAQPIQDPTATPEKEIKFAGNLFQDFTMGSTVKNSDSGAILANAKKSPQDYVANGNKSKNQSYTGEQLKAELSQKK